MVLSKIFFTECINLNTFQLLSVIHILLHFGTPLVSNTYPNFILPFFRLVALYTVFIASGFPRESEDISNLKNVVLIKTVLQMLFCKAHSISFRNSTSILCKPQFFHIYFRLTALYTAFIASGFLREAFFPRLFFTSVRALKTRYSNGAVWYKFHEPFSLLLGDSILPRTSKLVFRSNYKYLLNQFVQ